MVARGARLPTPAKAPEGHPSPAYNRKRFVTTWGTAAALPATEEV